MTRKEIVEDLDYAARRAEMIEAAPATGKQCWYLAGLLADHGMTADDIECGVGTTNAVLTKSKASRYISELLAA